MSTMALLTNTNKKLGRNIYSFNLPFETCARVRNRFCYQYCYAKHGAYTFPKVKAKFNENYGASLLPSFVDRIVMEIDSKQIKYIRIHSCGEFYSDEYIEKWMQIAKRCPNTRFLAFSRNGSAYHRDDIPRNLVIYQSEDKTSVDYHRPHAQLMIPTKPINEYRHMEVIGISRVCNLSCKDCKACWVGILNIIFLQRCQGAKFTPKGTNLKPQLRAHRKKMERCI